MIYQLLSMTIIPLQHGIKINNWVHKWKTIFNAHFLKQAQGVSLGRKVHGPSHSTKFFNFKCNPNTLPESSENYPFNV